MHLLQIPDPCLLAVLQCLADDATSLCSAARAHSRLHQAAMPVLTSIKARIWQQEKLNSLLLCLDRYSQHISHLDLGFYQDVDDDLRLQELPPALQLHSLQIYAAELQLQPGDGFDGVLGPAAAALTQLRLSDCWVLGGQTALAATLPQLTKLVHLAFSFKLFNERQYFPAYVLQDMQHLTYLEFACCLTGANGEEDPLALQPLQVLTRLVDLRLAIEDGRVSHHDFVITASMLSGACNLTRLDVSSTCFDFEAGALAGKPRLQHLQLASCRTATAEQVAQRLSQLQHLQQLTYLCLDDSIEAFVDDPPAAAFSALTASSKLQHLDLRNCTLPAAVWQHVFPAGRQLPLLRSLNISWIRQPPDNSAAAGPHGSFLASCCPSLQCLDIGGLQYSAELLGPLQGLSELQSLHVQTDPGTDGWEPLELVCQLTGLRKLQADWVPDWLLLQLTQLKQLTELTYSGQRATGYFKAEAPGDEPVWLQVLRRLVDHSDPGISQLAAAALRRATVARSMRRMGAQLARMTAQLNPSACAFVVLLLWCGFWYQLGS